MDRPARVQLAPARANLRSAVVGHRQQRVIGRDFDRTFWTSSGSSTQSRSNPRALLPAPAERGHRSAPAGRAQRQYPIAWQRRLSARLSSNRTPIPARHHWHSANHDHRAYLGGYAYRAGGQGLWMFGAWSWTMVLQPICLVFDAHRVGGHRIDRSRRSERGALMSLVLGPASARPDPPSTMLPAPRGPGPAARPDASHR